MISKFYLCWKLRSFPVYNNHDDDQGNDYDDDDDDGSDDYVDDGDHPYYHKDENANLPATIVSIISSSKRHDSQPMNVNAYWNI